MVRDVHNFSTTVAGEARASNGSIRPMGFIGQTYRSGRSDSKPTTPVGGTYVYPTNYDAYFASVSYQSGSGTWKERPDYWVPYPDPYTYWTVTRGGAPVGDLPLWGHTLTDVVPQPVIHSSVRARAQNNAIQALRGANLNAAVSAGELKDSARMAISIFGSIAESARELQRTDLYRNYSRRASAKGLASLYLTWLYGIKPLVSDLYSVLQVIEGNSKQPVGVVKVVAMDDTKSLPANTATKRYSGSLTFGYEVSYTVAARNPVSFELWRWGITNPLALAWELTPLSFVVDWFTGVGNYLGGLDASFAIKVLAGYGTSFSRFDIDYEERLTPEPSREIVIVTKEGWSKSMIRVKSMHREVLPFILPPVPYLDLGLDLRNVTSAIALITAGALRAQASGRIVIDPSARPSAE